MRIKKGDYVEVISGAEAGKRGRVLVAFPRKNKVIVEGINYIYRHMKKSQQNPQGGRVEKEAPMDISKVMLYCPHAQAPSRVSYRYEEPVGKKTEEAQTKPQDQAVQDGKVQDVVKREKRIKVRYAKKSNRQI